MKKYLFPYIALSLGLVLLLIVMKGSETQSSGNTAIPLLTLLVISEFGLFVTAIAAYLGIKHILASGVQFVYTATTVFCILLSLWFVLLGIELWPL